MSAPITIARLRELIAAIRDASSAMDRSVGGIEIHGISTKGNERAKAVVSCKAGVQRAVAAIDSALPSILDQLDAQAAEIERWRSDWKRIAADEAVWYTLSDIFGVEGMTNAAGVVSGVTEKWNERQARVAELEGLLRKHAALACGACMGTGAYLGDEDRDGPCDACGGTGSVLPEDVAAVLAGREGGR